MTPAVGTAVLGSGAVALAHALFVSRHGPVVLAAAPPSIRSVAAVERVPGPLLTLLLELGIVPAELDVDRLTRERVVGWEDAEPTPRSGPACAHIDRSALVRALWRRVEASPGIHVVDPVWRLEHADWGVERLVDATGRRALTARARSRPAPPWVATTCTVARRGVDPTMLLAAGPGGYAYRLGSARWLTVGWVGPGPPPRDGAAVAERIIAEDGSWVVDGVDLAAGVVHRVASADVPSGGGDPRVVRIGDAALGRDALASQGLAIGLSDARLAATADGARMLPLRHADGLRRHLDHVAGMLATCRHRAAPAWHTYRLWLVQCRGAERTGGAS